MDGISEELKPVLAIIEAKDPGIVREVINGNAYNVQVDSLAGADVMDIGAHIGSYTFIAKSVGHAESVTAFEPNPDSFATLQRVSSHLNNVTIHHTAIYPTLESKFIQLSGLHGVGTQTVGSTTMTESSDVVIPAMDLESAVALMPKTNNRRVLKIDCEGAEFAIFADAGSKLLAQFSEIHVEVHGWAVKPISRSAVDVMDILLRPAGFRRIASFQLFYWDYPGDPGRAVDVWGCTYVK